MPYDFDDPEDERPDDEGWEDEELDEDDDGERAAGREDDDEDPDEEEDGEEDEEDGLDDELDDDFPLGDGTADTSADVWCPYCGESSEISLDPGSGPVQRYVEDCPVCCRPWMLTVRYDEEGSATVVADPDDAMDED